MSKIVYSAMLIFLFCHSFAQSIDSSGPQVSIKLLDPQKLTIKYYLTSKTEISIYKMPKMSFNCDEWFMDVVVITESFISDQKKYLQMPCHADILPILTPEGTFGKFIKLNRRRRSPDYNIALDKDHLEKGQYRAKIKFYYFIKRQRQSVESEYIYFEI